MRTIILVLMMATISISWKLNAQSSLAAKVFEKDTIKTANGDLVLWMIGHGTLMIEAGGKVIHVDPVSREADYSQLPKADLILITHEHDDHLDRKNISMIRKENTHIAVSFSCKGLVPNADMMKNGDSKTYGEFTVEAVPAYNLVHKRPDGTPFHPKGFGNGYVLNYGGKRIYIAGDTENVPEMANLKNIAIAFLPMNLPYTMTPEMGLEAWKSFKSPILYPYHLGNTDINKIAELFKDEAVDLRLRKMK